MKQSTRSVGTDGQGVRRQDSYDRAILLLLLVLSLLASLVGCSGSGSGSGGDNNRPRERTSTIQGNVASVFAGLNPTGARATTFARWKELFTVPSAYAQTADLGGIIVVAVDEEVEIDRATTDADGNFTLRVSSGPITLRFRTGTFSASTTIEVPAFSTAAIVVTLRPGEVLLVTRIIIDEDDNNTDSSQSLRCTNGTIRLGREDTDLLIDGDGDAACLRVEGNCHVSLSFRNLTFRHCEQCVRVEGNGDVELIASGEILCEATEEGIRAEGNAFVTLEAESVTIVAPETGIRAAGNAEVAIDTPDCVIEEAEDFIRIDGNATVIGCED